jgi:catechol 2,3-dioxygenase-like lactoylglutathione lyase family enzyme
MVKLDHLALLVSDEKRSRDWYVSNFGFRTEFEVPERGTVAIQDDAGLTVFLVRSATLGAERSCVLTLQVSDVEDEHRKLSARGVRFEHSPQKLLWGYGAELRDPDGYLLQLWDETSMREKGGA